MQPNQCLVPRPRPHVCLATANPGLAIRAVGAKLFYLPPYSPDLNPIEQAFSKLKTLLRKANARSFDQVEDAVAVLLQQIEPEECLNFFREAGYAPT